MLLNCDRTITLKISNNMLDPAIEVRPPTSYGGDTSTRSAPTRFRSADAGMDNKYVVLIGRGDDSYPTAQYAYHTTT